MSLDRVVLQIEIRRKENLGLNPAHTLTSRADVSWAEGLAAPPYTSFRISPAVNPFDVS
jgi:hypothetical protein